MSIDPPKVAKEVVFRRGTTAEHSSFTGVAGELTVDKTKDTAIVHDNITIGGTPQVREDSPQITGDMTLASSSKIVFEDESTMNTVPLEYSYFLSPGNTFSPFSLGKYYPDANIKIVKVIFTVHKNSQQDTELTVYKNNEPVLIIPLSSSSVRTVSTYYDDPLLLNLTDELEVVVSKGSPTGISVKMGYLINFDDEQYLPSFTFILDPGF